MTQLLSLPKITFGHATCQYSESRFKTQTLTATMATNEHLLDNFNACKETRTLAGQLLREAKIKTAAGSGHEIGALSTGLAAVCMLIASERRANTLIY